MKERGSVYFVFLLLLAGAVLAFSFALRSRFLYLQSLQQWRDLREKLELENAVKLRWFNFVESGSGQGVEEVLRIKEKNDEEMLERKFFVIHAERKKRKVTMVVEGLYKGDRPLKFKILYIKEEQK